MYKYLLSSPHINFANANSANANFQMLILQMQMQMQKHQATPKNLCHYGQASLEMMHTKKMQRKVGIGWPAVRCGVKRPKS